MPPFPDSKSPKIAKKVKKMPSGTALRKKYENVTKTDPSGPQKTVIFIVPSSQNSISPCHQKPLKNTSRGPHFGPILELFGDYSRVFFGPSSPPQAMKNLRVFATLQRALELLIVTRFPFPCQVRFMY